MEDSFGFEGRVVPNRHRAIRFAGAESGRSLGHRHGPADALVRDTGVGSLETMANAHVADHVIRQNLEQPHRVHVPAKFASELFKVATRSGQEREELIVAAVVAAT